MERQNRRIPRQRSNGAGFGSFFCFRPERSAGGEFLSPTPPLKGGARGKGKTFPAAGLGVFR